MALFLFPSHTLSQITKFTFDIKDDPFTRKQKQIINENTYNLLILFRRDLTSNSSLRNPPLHMNRDNVKMSGVRTRLLGQLILYILTMRSTVDYLFKLSKNNTVSYFLKTIKAMSLKSVINKKIEHLEVIQILFHSILSLSQLNRMLEI